MFKIKYKSLQTIKSSLNNRNLKLDSVFFGTPCRGRQTVLGPFRRTSHASNLSES